MASAQPVLAQRSDRPVDEIAVASDSSGSVLSRFRTAFGSNGRRGEWEVGWHLARDLGTAGLPALRRVFAEEGNPTGRFAVLGAIALAASEPTTSDFIWERLERANGTRERFVTLFCLGLGVDGTPAGARGVAISASGRVESLLDLLGQKDTKPVVRVAGCLVARRLGVRPPVVCYETDDVGVVAAACFASRPSADREGDRSGDGGRWWRKGSKRKDDEHLGLVQRGLFLGGSAAGRVEVAGNGIVDEALRRARATLPDPVELAAAVFLAESCAPGTVEAAFAGGSGNARPPSWLVSVLGSSAAHRSGSVDDLVRSLEGTSAFDRQFARSAVSLSLACPSGRLASVVAALPSAARSPDVVQAFGLGLAMRRAADPGDARLRAAIGRLELPVGPGTTWLECALQPSPALAGRGESFGDVRLGRALAALCRGDLPLVAEVQAIEGALWRAGYHPRRTIVEVRGLLVRDLLITGTTWGRSLYQPRGTPYFARGLAAGDPTYEVASRLLEFVTSPRERRVPAAHRLR